MDFDLTDEQRLLKDSVDRLITDRYGFDQRKKYMAEASGFSAAMWSQYAEQGLLGLPFAETHGGFGGGPVETMIVMEAFGRGLILEPFFATVILSGGLIQQTGTATQQSEMIPLIAQGRMKLAFAHIERRSRWDLTHIATTAKHGDGDWTISGAKSVVLHGDSADRILVTARSEGDGVGLFLVDANAPGVERRGYPTQDGLRAAEITFRAQSDGAAGRAGGGAGGH